jgi:hypothetical protein
MFSKTKLTLAVTAVALTSSIAAFAVSTPSVTGDGGGHPNQQEVIILARRGRGADDKPGDDRGVHGAGHPNQEQVIILSRRGADDPAGQPRREDRRADRRKA